MPVGPSCNLGSDVCWVTRAPAKGVVTQPQNETWEWVPQVKPSSRTTTPLHYRKKQLKPSLAFRLGREESGLWVMWPQERVQPSGGRSAERIPLPVPGDGDAPTAQL